MKEIPWERTSDGTSARLKGYSGRFVIPVLLLLNTADTKMTEVSAISADFKGKTLLFERQLGVYLKMGTHAEYLGVYTTDKGEEDGETQEKQLHGFPVLCIRRAHWNRQQDIQQFRQARSMEEYVKGDKQIDSRIIFLPAVLSQEIGLLAEDAQELIRQGIKLSAVTRIEPRWDKVQVECIKDSLVFSLTYAPRAEKNEELERWIEQWQQSFAKVDVTEGIVPDRGCFINYPRSLMETLEAFPKESFGLWYSRLERRRSQSIEPSFQTDLPHDFQQEES